MNKIIKESQLMAMINECVNQVLSEEKPRKSMNESNLQSYIKQLVNEEIENEGFWGKMKGAAKGLGQSISGEANKAMRGIKNTGLNNEYQGQSFKDRINAAGNNIRRNAQAGDRNQDMQNFIAQVQKMVNSGILPPKAMQAGEQFIDSLNASMLGSKGGMNRAYNSAYGE